MAESDNILTKLQDLLVYLIPQLNKFPRDQKFVLGDRIETKLLDVQEDCLRAYYSRDKRGHLLEANLVRVQIHLCTGDGIGELFNAVRRTALGQLIRKIFGVIIRQVHTARRTPEPFERP